MTDHFDAWIISFCRTEPEILFFYDCRDTTQDGVFVRRRVLAINRNFCFKRNSPVILSVSKEIRSQTLPLKAGHFDAWITFLRLIEPEILFFYDCRDTTQDGVFAPWRVLAINRNFHFKRNSPVILGVSKEIRSQTLPLKAGHFDAWITSLRLIELEILFFYDCRDAIQDGVFARRRVCEKQKLIFGFKRIAQ